MSLLPKPVAITAAAVRSCAGRGAAAHVSGLMSGMTALSPLGELLGSGSSWANLPGGWLRDRAPMKGRRYGSASSLAVVIAREALDAAGWSEEMKRGAWVFAGSSRGNTGELLGERYGRRPVKRFAASNSMHSEIAAAVSIEHGLHGGWHLFSNGCSSGLDAAGMAAIAVSSGMAPRALVVSVDLPLLPALLGDFAETRLLSTDGVNDPYSERTTGFLPAEGAAALTIEPARDGSPHITGCWWNSDAWDSVGLPADGAPVRELFTAALTACGRPRRVAVCPHASGTHVHGMAERNALDAALRAAPAEATVHLLKPFTGHALGASGALDLAILHAFLTQGLLPPNLPGLTAGSKLFTLPDKPDSSAGALIVKISVGMGGHNTLLTLTPP
jgi:3-oxoacyl-[acyl-carrier-protein] synthase II